MLRHRSWEDLSLLRGSRTGASPDLLSPGHLREQQGGGGAWTQGLLENRNGPGRGCSVASGTEVNKDLPQRWPLGSRNNPIPKSSVVKQ